MFATVEYSLIGTDPNALLDPQGHIPGQWLQADPLVRRPGYWDLNSTPDNPSDDSFVQGDYHLKSQAGHWDPVTRTWVRDDVTSPAIDAGDPASPIGQEPFPNGGRTNMGAYGGTAQASKSYFGTRRCSTIIPADINGDCRVDWIDMSILASHWREDHAEYSPVTTTCRFIPSQSSMHTVSRVSHSRRVEGDFRLTIDWAAGVATFDEVNATFGDGTGVTNDLGAFFNMAQLVSTKVTSTGVEFVFRKNIPHFPGADVEFAMTFREGLVQVTGVFTAPVWDGASYGLRAVAVPVDDPRVSPSLAQRLETIVTGDINDDCRVDLADLALMAAHWEVRLPTARR